MPDETQLPSQRDLMKLPRWARVAFAVRCGRRAQPLFTLFWPAAPREHVDAIDRALTVAEASARTKRADAGTSRAAAAAARAVAAAARAAGHIAARASAASADAAAAAADASAAYAPRAAAAAADAAAAYAARAAAFALTAARVSLVAGMASDYRLLLAWSERLHWTDDSPVEPDAMGPLWPDPPGEPTWANPPEMPPSDSIRVPDAALQLAIEIIPGNATPEMIADYLESVSDLFHACGGVALRFERAGSKIYAVPEVPV